MMRIQLLFEVISDIRNLADGLDALAQSIEDNDNQPKTEIHAESHNRKSTITHEKIRELAVKLSRKGKREEIQRLIEQYGVTNVTAIADDDLESFYSELAAMEVE